MTKQNAPNNQMRSRIRCSKNADLQWQLSYDRMRGISLIKTSVLVSTLFGLSVVVDNIRLSGQTATPKADGFEAGVGMHETRAQPGSSFQLPKGNEHSAEPEQESPPQPTRTSFMATWHRVTGATGYLLDVSVSSSFNSFLDGYHDLDVGHVEGEW